MKAYFLIISFVVIVGCDTTSQIDQLKNLTLENKEKWESFGLDTYSYLNRSTCYSNCETIDLLPPQTVNVTNGVVTSVYVAELGLDENIAGYKTINELFNILLDAIDKKVDRISENQATNNIGAKFDDIYGHPIEAYIEINKNEHESAYGFKIDQILTFNTQQIFINHYKTECGSFELKLCLFSKEKMADDWLFFYDNIIGFQYEWGYVYKLNVKVEKIKNPPQDASSVKYTLLETLSKEKEPSQTLFDISISRAPNLISKESSSLYKFYNDKRFTCDATDCSNIDSLISQDTAILFEFSHQNDPSQPLTLSQIKCSNTRGESFLQSCT